MSEPRVVLVFEPGQWRGACVATVPTVADYAPCGRQSQAMVEAVDERRNLCDVHLAAWMKAHGLTYDLNRW